MKIECCECKYGRPKPNMKFRCIVDGWEHQREVSATDTCERSEDNEILQGLQTSD
ncbi:hypothetical protein Ami103574_02485 [Aminipila butyrica]|uniref:Uncharacterized protein n=1 Tax=Aminipila butyrica TaxID=433296 RepID=A0A858BRR5_9FIRM|nr:hypothetical protein [Aminipila butyrica]QIB68247.1 hypothetical protein Ami103574_02485 [Aminipila butyrica]